MKWITELPDFKDLMLRAEETRYVDSGRHPTTLRKLLFDDAEITTARFLGMLQDLMRWSGANKADYVVLDPDPVNYFYRHFGRYPAMEIMATDPPGDYLRYMNLDPGNSPADAVGVNWNQCAILPTSDNWLNSWFVHALRDDGSAGCHLWLREDWVDKLVSSYPGGRQSTQLK